MTAQQSGEQEVADVALYEQLAHRCPGLIERDQVVSVRHFAFSGHVYNFQTANGLIAANGIITSNCRCRVIALTDKQAARFQAADARRLADDPELAAARASAQPDKGWDYSVCAEPTEGLKRAIAQKVQKSDTALVSELGTEIDDIRAAWPVRGLARRFPANDLATLETLLKEYAYRLPGDLPHGVKFVREGGPHDDFYMATNGRGGFWFREVEYGSFNSRRDLFGALAKCSDKRGPALSRDEEYAIESLWHEIQHNKQTGMDAVARLSAAHPVRRIAETLNQAVARLTYPRFVERLGGDASHQAWIIENGYGYAESVTRLWQVVRACGLEPADLAGDLATVNREADLLEGSRHMAAVLARRSGYSAKKIQAALDLLMAKDAFFLSSLGGIRS